jgi:CheY-like chemotaxis protein
MCYPDKPCTVLIVDDSKAFQKTLRKFLSRIPWIVVANAVASGEDAVKCVCQDAFDLVLMDISLKGMSGLAATRIIKMRENPPLVVMLTQHENKEYRELADEVRAEGFVTKTDLFSELMPTIEKNLIKIGYSEDFFRM